MVQRHHGFFQRRFGIKTVRIEDIDVIETHAFQALVAGRDQVLARTPFAIGAAPHVIASLGGNDHLIPVGFEVGFQDVAKGLFGGTSGRAVIVLSLLHI